MMRSPLRSEEHTSELQSRENVVCRLLLEKKKQRALRGACAARTVANGGGVRHGQGRQGRARGARVPWRLAGGAGHAASVCFFFNDTATTEIYTLSLHDALPI